MQERVVRLDVVSGRGRHRRVVVAGRRGAGGQIESIPWSGDPWNNFRIALSLLLPPSGSRTTAAGTSARWEIKIQRKRGGITLTNRRTHDCQRGHEAVHHHLDEILWSSLVVAQNIMYVGQDVELPGDAVVVPVWWIRELPTARANQTPLLIIEVPKKHSLHFFGEDFQILQRRVENRIFGNLDTRLSEKKAAKPKSSTS